MDTLHVLMDGNHPSKEIMYEKSVKLAIKNDVLTRLFETGQICASDFRCLDCTSKRCVMKLCLNTCLECTH